MRGIAIGACCLAFVAAGSAAFGQSRAGTTGTGTVGTQGLMQSGGLTSSAALQRDTSTFVGGSAGSFLTPPTSVASATGGATGCAALGGGAGFGGFSSNQLTSLGLVGGLQSIGAGGLAAGGFGRGGMGFGGQGQQGRLQQQQQQGGRGTTAAPLRISMRIGFVPQTPAPTVVSTQFVRRLGQLPALSSVQGVAMNMVGRTAVLSGVVSSEEERVLIANLALLEPGIADVQNELVVQPGAAPTVSSLQPQ